MSSEALLNSSLPHDLVMGGISHGGSRQTTPSSKSSVFSHCPPLPTVRSLQHWLACQTCFYDNGLQITQMQTEILTQELLGQSMASSSLSTSDRGNKLMNSLGSNYSPAHEPAKAPQCHAVKSWHLEAFLEPDSNPSNHISHLLPLKGGHSHFAPLSTYCLPTNPCVGCFTYCS